MAVSVNSTVLIGTVTPVGGLDATGFTDVSVALQAFLATVSDGATVDFGGGTYRIEAGIKLTSRNGLTLQNGFFIQNFIDPAGTITGDPRAAGSGGPGTFPTTNVYRSRCGFLFTRCDHLTLINVSVRGPDWQFLSDQTIPSGGYPDASWGYHSTVEAQHGFSFLGCTNVDASGCSSSYVFGDHLNFAAANEGSINVFRSDRLNVTDFNGQRSSRMGVSFTNCTNVHLDGAIGWSQRSLFDWEPNAHSDIIDSIEIGPMVAGPHGLNLIASGPPLGQITNIDLHDWTEATAGISFSGAIGDSTNPEPTSGWTFTNFTFTGQQGNPAPPFGGQPGLLLFDGIDDVTFTNVDVAAQSARGMFLATSRGSSNITVTGGSVTNGFNTVWDFDTGAPFPYSLGWTPPVGAIAYDGFNQGGPTDRLILSDSGHAWQDPPASVHKNGLTGAGTVGQSQAAINCPITLDAGVSDCTVTITTVNLDAVKDSGLSFRLTDSANFWSFGNKTGGLFKNVGGVQTTVDTAAGTGADGDVIAVVLAGSSITVKRNGATVAGATDAFNQTATEHGFWIASSVVPKLDNFSVV